jgi:hypothetical protein
MTDPAWVAECDGVWSAADFAGDTIPNGGLTKMGVQRPPGQAPQFKLPPSIDVATLRSVQRNADGTSLLFDVALNAQQLADLSTTLGCPPEASADLSC